MIKPGEQTREDITRMLGGLANVASAMRHQARSDIQARVERIINRMDLVKRGEYEELESMLQQARTHQEELEARIAELEKTAASSKKGGSSKNTGTKGKNPPQSKSGTQRKTSQTATNRKSSK